MKHYFIAFLVLSFLNFRATLPMEEHTKSEDAQPKLSAEILPIELWNLILENICFDPTLIKETTDIHQAIDLLKQELPKIYKIIPLVCKDFQALQTPEFKKKIKQIYICYLNHRFLGCKEGEEGLYPKNFIGDWEISPSLNKMIAQFIGKGEFKNLIIFEIIKLKECPIKIYKQILNLLLFYGAEGDQKLINKAIDEYYEYCRNQSYIKYITTNFNCGGLESFMIYMC